MSTIVLKKRFQLNLLDIIARGEFGDMYKAVDLKNVKREVVAKKITSKDNMDSSGEIKIHYMFRHANIVEMLDHSYVSNNLWVIYEKSAIGDLNSYFGHNIRGLKTIIHIAREVLCVVTYLHKQNPPIFHRGIKPNYIIPFDNSEIPLVKISGFARSIEYEGPMKTPELRPDEYTAPECYGKDGLWHILSDVFSIA